MLLGDVTTLPFLIRKYEEVYPPEVDEFVYITDDTYTKQQLLRMEQHLLRVLSFDLTAPTVLQFLMQYTLEEHICARTVNLALVRREGGVFVTFFLNWILISLLPAPQYLSELSLLEVDPFVQYLPSKTAAAAYCLANYTLNGALWVSLALNGYAVLFTVFMLKPIFTKRGLVSDSLRNCMPSPVTR